MGTDFSHRVFVVTVTPLFSISQHREELVRLRTEKPAPRENKEATDIPPPKPLDYSSPFLRTSGGPICITTQDSDEGDKDPSEGSDQAQQAQVQAQENSKEAFIEDDDSDKVTGLEEAAREDQNLEDDDENVVDAARDADSDEIAKITPEHVSSIFQRLLKLSTGDNVSSGVISKSGNHDKSNHVPSASNPSIMRNGRYICNLPDHPIHAGATAIVAVLIGDVLTVANAGDSRGVICHAGHALPLSYDHKPQQEGELNRIKKAGGFVNHFGRVNGNLNLSRAIGDLKYKQVPGIEPKDQIITAQPDIMQ